MSTNNLSVNESNLIEKFLENLNLQSSSANGINDLYNTTITANTGATLSWPSQATTALGSTISNNTYTNTVWTNSQVLGEEELDKKISRAIKKELKPVLVRLAILAEPNPRVLEQFESLKNAYDQYRMLESLMMSEIEKITKS